MTYNNLWDAINYDVNKAVVDIFNKYQTKYNIVCEEPTENETYELDLSSNHITYAIADILAKALNVN